MRIIGVTGGIGSGKSSLCAELKKLGAEIIDADLISHEITQKGKTALFEITEAFGKEVITELGELNRKKLGSIVFGDPEKLKILNKITHKYIFEEMHRRIEEATAPVVVLEVPLLFQCDFPIKCDLTVAVVADKEVRIRRIMQRDGIDRSAALLRMEKQLIDSDYKRLADVCFENNGDVDKIREFANSLFQGVHKIF